MTASVASAPSMADDLAGLFRVAVRLDQLGVKVLSVRWVEYEAGVIQIADRSGFNIVVEQYGLRVGMMFGDVQEPQIPATGIIDGVHLKVFAPAHR